MNIIKIRVKKIIKIYFDHFVHRIFKMQKRMADNHPQAVENPLSAFNMSVDWRSRHFAFRGRAGEPPRRFAPAGSLLPRTPAGVFVPSAPINRCLQ
jgi:hypothetical protein